jgi:hypothetical protein
MTAYILAFALAFWPAHSSHRLSEMRAIAADIASTDATPLEALTLANIAALESNFERSARGREGERGAFQVHPPAISYGADEALRRLRAQGIAGYIGCANHPDSEKCASMAAHRTEKAILWRLAFDPPVVDDEVAVNP